jgi:catabolite regulation protein CreA
MTNVKSSQLSVLDVVAPLADLPAAGLARGQVGTVVEILGNDTVLVEFSDDDGRAYAIVSCPIADLLLLHYEPEAAA